MHLNIIMKLGLCTIPHFEDIAPCNILDEDSCCMTAVVVAQQQRWQRLEGNDGGNDNSMRAAAADDGVDGSRRGGRGRGPGGAMRCRVEWSLCFA